MKFQVIVRATEGWQYRGYSHMRRYVWITWVVEETYKAAAKVAADVGGIILRQEKLFTIVLILVFLMKIGFERMNHA